jgi:hypothetical protein
MTTNSGTRWLRRREMQPHPKKVAGKIRDYLAEATRLAAFA